MADYIERQAALDMVRGLEERYVNNLPPMVDKVDVCNALDTLPSADVQPVRHGVWMEENRRPRSAMFYCSECHRTAYDIQPTRDKTWEKRCRYAYCPNCGARMLKYTGMDGEQNDIR